MRIYLDNNATTAVVQPVLEAMLPWFTQRWGNPSSPHGMGAEPSAALARARAAVARLVGGRPQEIVFTSGGTEAIQLALASALAAAPDRARTLASEVEHAAVLRPLEDPRGGGPQLELIGVDGSGRLDLAALLATIDEDVALVSLQVANNETGVVTPAEELARVSEACRACGALLHLDAVQAPGKLSIDAPALGADLLSLAAHKFHGPKGVGALWVREGTALEPLFEGGPQESGNRAGTENVPGIVGMGRAAELALEHLESGGPGRVCVLRDRLETALAHRLEPVRIHGAGAPRLPNTTSLAFPGADAEVLLGLLDCEELFVSTGAACRSRLRAPSHVLVAMGQEELASSTLRISLSRLTLEEELERAVDALEGALGTARALGYPPTEVPQG